MSVRPTTQPSARDLQEQEALLEIRGGAKKQEEVAAIIGGKASIPASIFNLVNNVAGAGILTLSSGMATGTGWVPAILICSVLGLLSSHTFAIIGEACELTGEVDFKGLWARTIGKKSTYIVDGVIATMCLACAVIYSGILGDVFTPLLDSAGVPSQFNGRTSNILIITIALLFPMSLIKNLSALAFTSILGFCAIMYTVLFIVIRALDGTYTLGSGKFVTDGVLATLPKFAKSSLWNFDFTSLVLISNLGLAYIAHYNAPAFYRELSNTNSKRFAKMVYISFVVLTLLYIVTMSAGYSTFGDVCQGNILLNYHPSDILSTLGRVATGFSILFGFPLVAAGAREGVAGFCSGLGYNAVGEDKNHALLVAGILAFVTAISCTITDVSLVVGLTGAAMGSTIVYIIPPIIYQRAVGLIKGINSNEHNLSKRNMALIPFGLAIGGLGVFMTLKK